MKTKITFLSCIVWCMVQSFSTFSQWVNCPNTWGLHGYSLALQGTDIWFGNQGDIRKSTDDGASFIQSSSGIPSSSQISEIFVSDNTIFAHKATYNDHLYRSTDNGGTWELKNTGLTWAEPAPFYVSNITQIGNTLYIGTSNGVYQSTDDGDNWSEIVGNNWSSLGLASKSVRVVKNNNGILYAGTNYGLFVSSDNGITWTVTGFNGNEVNDVEFYGSEVFVCINNGDMIYRSIDNCSTFTSVINTLPCDFIRKMVVADSKILAAADQGFLVYDIATEVYAYENTGLTSNALFSLVISGDNIYTGVQTHGIFKRALSDFGIINSASLESKEQLTTEIYPNPSNGVFQISNQNDQATSVTIYNITGEKVYENTRYNANEIIDLSNQSKGVYVLHIVDGSNLVTKKIVVQ